MAVATRQQKPVVLDPKAWQAQRRMSIGASDVPAILGLDQYRDHLQVWAQKTGRCAPPDDSVHFRFGHAVEPFIASEFERETGIVLENPGDYTVYRDPDFPALCCTPDRLTTDGTPVELKTVHAYVQGDWDGSYAPLKYQAQLQIQMKCLGVHAGYLAGLLGGTEIAIRRFEHNPRFLNATMDRLREFWKFVETDTEPPADWNKRIAIDGYKALHPDDNGETVQLPTEMADTIATLEATKERIKELESAKEGFEAQLRVAIGDATFGEVGPYRYSHKSQTRKGSIKVEPDLRDALVTAGIKFQETKSSTFRVLRKLKIK